MGHRYLGIYWYQLLTQTSGHLAFSTLLLAQDRQQGKEETLTSRFTSQALP